MENPDLEAMWMLREDEWKDKCSRNWGSMRALEEMRGQIERMGSGPTEAECMGNLFETVDQAMKNRLSEIPDLARDVWIATGCGTAP